MSKKILAIYHPEGEVFEYEGKQVVAEKDTTWSIDDPCCKGCCFFNESDNVKCAAIDLNCLKDDVIFKIVK